MTRGARAAPGRASSHAAWLALLAPALLVACSSAQTPTDGGWDADGGAYDADAGDGPDVPERAFELAEACAAACALPAGTTAELARVCLVDVCAASCVRTAGGLDEPCAACLAAKHRLVGACTSIDCSCLQVEPVGTDCVTECGGGPHPDGARCWLDAACRSGRCYGTWNTAGFRDPSVCRAACITTDDETYSCQTDEHCCTGVCCPGCASHGLCIET